MGQQWHDSSRRTRTPRSVTAWLTLCVILIAATTGSSAADQRAPASTAKVARYEAVITRTADGIPHITASDYGSLGFGYGFSLASDDICTMADGYLTVEGQRSRYFGAAAYVPQSAVSNLDSDVFWKSVIDNETIKRLLAIRSGPNVITPQVRELMGGYVAGYNRYLASVGGSEGVPDGTCRGQPWVKPITILDAYLLVYQLIDMEGQAGDITGIAEAQPPAISVAGVAGVAGAVSASLPSSATDLTARSAAVTRALPGTGGLPSLQEVRALGGRTSPAGRQSGIGSNAIAVGSAGTRDHENGLLLGNPHFPWDGIDRMYEAQFTIPGVVNVEGATVYGVPVVVIGFTDSMAWSHTVSAAYPLTPYQLTLVPGQPTEYVYNGRPVAMTSRTVTVETSSANGTLAPVRRTLWYSRYGPVISSLNGTDMPWTNQMAFALDDPDASDLRFLNEYVAIDKASSAAAVLSSLKEYEAEPWLNTFATDSAGHALFADIQVIPHVTDAEAEACDTAVGAISFATTGLPVLDGSRASCAWGTDPDSAVPGIFGPSAEPTLLTRDFVENSNDSYWLANPAHPLTGFPLIMGPSGDFQALGSADLRTRDALTMIMGRISGTDGLGPAGFTLRDMENLMFSEVEYGATLVKAQLVSMCRSFPGGRAPTTDGTIPVGDSCDVLAAWNGREDIDSRGAVLFRVFWESALSLAAGPWLHPFTVTDPLGTPYGLNTGSTAVRQAFGDALATLTAAHLPYDVALGTVQYVVRDGTKIPLPGGPSDPDGELNGIYQDILQPGTDPEFGSSYIQAVSWVPGDSCPRAGTLLTYSESGNPDSPYYDDQTKLFSHSQWVTTYICAAQVAAHALSTSVVSG
jgi:acyl-homoserine-lactone acylase